MTPETQTGTLMKEIDTTVLTSILPKQQSSKPSQSPPVSQNPLPHPAPLSVLNACLIRDWYLNIPIPYTSLVYAIDSGYAYLSIQL